MSKATQTQIERIEYFEKILDGAAEVIRELRAAGEEYEAAKKAVQDGPDTGNEKLKAAQDGPDPGCEGHKAAQDGQDTVSDGQDKAADGTEPGPDKLEEAGYRYAMAGQAFMDAQRSIWELSAYYGSQDWWDDFHASENGELPDDLKCGVLSEDGVYNVLSENDELIKQM